MKSAAGMKARLQPVSLCVVAVLTLLAGAEKAEVRQARYEWHNVVISDGGFIPVVVFSRAEPGLAYARTDIGSVYRRDADRGRWIPLQGAMPQGNWFHPKRKGEQTAIRAFALRPAAMRLA